jgi:hypothetical protein
MITANETVPPRFPMLKLLGLHGLRCILLDPPLCSDRTATGGHVLHNFPSSFNTLGRLLSKLLPTPHCTMSPRTSGQCVHQHRLPMLIDLTLIHMRPHALVAFLSLSAILSNVLLTMTPSIVSAGGYMASILLVLVRTLYLLLRPRIVSLPRDVFSTPRSRFRWPYLGARDQLRP